MHRCEFCSREFTRALYLRRHMFVHSDEKPFECNWCGKKLRSEYNLKYHMQRHVGVKEYVCGEQFICDSLDDSSISPLLPDLCGKECSSRALLDKHLLTHGTNNAFQCNICNRSYRHQSTLSRHSKMHTQISKCHICFITFRYDSHLRKHLLEEHNDVDGINQPRITPEVVKIKKKPSTVLEIEPTIVDPNLYYAQPDQSTVIVNNVMNDFKYGQ
jgi:KRAB domain-containing zinc finger protein